MAMILAFDGVALRERWFVQWPDGTRASRAPSARRRFASTEVADAALYHRTGDCHATPWGSGEWGTAQCQLHLSGDLCA